MLRMVLVGFVYVRFLIYRQRYGILVMPASQIVKNDNKNVQFQRGVSGSTKKIIIFAHFKN